MQMNRNGFLYVIDRTNGKLLSAKPFGKVNWATHVDMTDRPAGRDRAGTKAPRRRSRSRCGRRRAARRTGRMRRSIPNTGLLYANTMHHGDACTSTWRPSRTRSASATGTSRTCHMPRAARPAVGHIDAIDPLTGKQKWRVPLHDYQIWSAMLATGGGLAVHRQGRPASSSRSTPTPARSSGSSRPAPASTRMPVT